MLKLSDLSYTEYPAGYVLEAPAALDSSWLECAGGSVLRSAYPLLSAVLGEVGVNVNTQGVQVATRAAWLTDSASQPTPYVFVFASGASGVEMLLCAQAGRLTSGNYGHFVRAYRSAASGNLTTLPRNAGATSPNGVPVGVAADVVAFLSAVAGAAHKYVAGGSPATIGFTPAAGDYIRSIAQRGSYYLLGIGGTGTGSKAQRSGAGTVLSAAFTAVAPATFTALFPAGTDLTVAATASVWYVFGDNGAVASNSNADPSANSWISLGAHNLPNAGNRTYRYEYVDGQHWLWDVGNAWLYMSGDLLSWTKIHSTALVCGNWWRADTDEWFAPCANGYVLRRKAGVNYEIAANALGGDYGIGHNVSTDRTLLAGPFALRVYPNAAQIDIDIRELTAATRATNLYLPNYANASDTGTSSGALRRFIKGE